jgi:integrase/recombinase XerD
LLGPRLAQPPGLSPNPGGARWLPPRSAALVPATPVFTNTERLALAGYLAGYSGLIRQAYELDLRQYASWCQQHHLRLFSARRADIECFARDLEARGRARATVTRRLCTIAGFYRYAVEEELLDHSPAAHVRRPRLDYESHATALDRNELGALLVAAGLGPPAEHALISLLALNGLRVSEATGADIEALGIERGHRTLVVTRKGGKVVTIPLAPRTARAIDLAIGEPCAGPVFLAPDGRRLDRHGAARIVRQAARRAGITKPVGPHTLRHAFITAAQGRGVASDASFRLRCEAGAVEAAALQASGRGGWQGAGHAAGAGVLVPGCTGWQDAASRSVALGDWLMHPAHARRDSDGGTGDAGAGRRGRRGAGFAGCGAAGGDARGVAVPAAGPQADRAADR